MFDLFNTLFGSPSDPVSYDAKHAAEWRQAMREMEVDQLERLTGRNRLDLAVNGFPMPYGPLDIVGDKTP